ncbi:MAG TPA: DegT/DnrJ/EryC1/StrS family aminotransferase [Thermoanaerobaculia bacterium]|nr:DegT/DnrJ/EryC1/StrS family aminotransferase [Thermoanaerobaculia bacterium]
MPERLIPVAGPSITQREIDYVTDAVTNAWYSNAGVYHTRFERAFADYLGVKHAMALPSCTSAIHLALAALGVGPGDEVIVPDITWIASAAPIAYVGATPCFADVDRDSWCLDPRSFESLITDKTKAVIPVDLYGNMADMPAIVDIAARRGIAVIEDAAEAVGAQHGTRMAGSFGDAGVFSFHGSKTLTTGEGGMLVTNRTEVFERAQVLRDHGRRSGDKAFYNREVGFKYKMSALQAALGLAQLERIEELIERKREAFGWYAEELASVDGVTLNHETPGTKSVYWMVTAVVDSRFGVTKDQIQARLAERGIDTRPFFHPLSSLPAYAELPEAAAARERNVVSYAISPAAINLPSSLSLTREDVARVGRELRAVLAS